MIDKKQMCLFNSFTAVTLLHLWRSSAACYNSSNILLYMCISTFCLTWCGMYANVKGGLSLSLSYHLSICPSIRPYNHPIIHLALLLLFSLLNLLIYLGLCLIFQLMSSKISSCGCSSNAELSWESFYHTVFPPFATLQLRYDTILAPVLILFLRL